MLMMDDCEIVERYTKRGVSISILADLNDCDVTDIRRVLKENGVKIPPGRPKKGNTMKSEELKTVEKSHVIEQAQNVNRGTINKEEVAHMPKAVREALSKEEIFLTEMIDEYTSRVKEIQEFRKKYL